MFEAGWVYRSMQAGRFSRRERPAWGLWRARAMDSGAPLPIAPADRLTSAMDQLRREEKMALLVYLVLFQLPCHFLQNSPHEFERHKLNRLLIQK